MGIATRKDLDDAVELAHRASQDVVTLAIKLDDKAALTHGLRAKAELTKIRTVEAITADEAEKGIG